MPLQMLHMPFLLACLATGAAATFSNMAATRTVTISNTAPRTSPSGAILDAHDGKVTLHAGVFYWHAMSYGGCTEPAGPNGCADWAAPEACGFRYDHNVSLLTSTDLVHWSEPTTVFSVARDLGVPGAVVYAPKVLRRSDGTWVLWVNWNTVRKGFNGSGSPWAQSYYATATAPSPAGPFVVATLRVNSRYASVGDLNLLSSGGAEAYVIYTGNLAPSYTSRFVMSVEQLTADWTDSLGAAASSGPIDAAVLSVEGPAAFRTPDGTYHAVYGKTCCFCADGTRALSEYTAAHPLGPWVLQGVVGDTYLGAQSTDIFAYADGAGQPAFLFYGNRWQSSPDGTKGHDFTLWAPVTFDARGTMAPLQRLDSFNVTLRMDGDSEWFEGPNGETQWERPGSV